jgi:hypothetical protein
MITYTEFAFQQSTLLIFNLAITCYLTVVMFFISLALQQIKYLQQDIINAIDNDKLTCSMYISAKEKINDLQIEFFLLIQVLTIIAGINIIAFLIRVGKYHHLLYDNDGDYSDMILSDLHMIPYILKEIIFFYYILLLVSSTNTLYDILVNKLNIKCWQLKKQSNDNILNDFVLMHLDALANPIVLCIGPLAVRRKRVLVTLSTLVLYCIYILLHFKPA